MTDKVNVELQWNVQVVSPKPGLMAKICRKHNRVSRDLRILVTDIEVPDDIECKSDNLFSILYREQIIPQEKFPVDVTLTDMAMPFQLLFHQGEIKDCKKPQDENPRSYPIKFKVVLQDLEGESIDAVDEQIDVVFEPLGVKPKFEIDLKEEIQYSSSLGLEEIGTFAAWLNEEFSFTPDQLAKLSIKLYKDNQEVKDLIYFDNQSKVKDIRILRSHSNVIKLPIFVDFTTISNPLKEEEIYTIETSIILSASYSPEVRETILKQKQFKLLKDLQGTELKVYIQVLDSEPQLYEFGSSVSVPMKFIPHSHLMGQANVILSNIATDNSNPNAGLYIKNLTLTEITVGDVRIIGDDNAFLNHFIKINGVGVDAMSSIEGLFIPNGADAMTTINIYFDPSNIADLLNSESYDFQIKSLLTFDYWEDKDGLGVLSDRLRKEGKVSVVWDLYLEPNPEWLCVDYGSSAIVCRYDNEILNLKEQKDRIFRRAENGRFSEDNIENNTQFIPSDIVFHTVNDAQTSTLCSQQPQDATIPYLNLSVCLSPTSSLLRNDIRTQLPCLKILVGNEFLPPKQDFMTFQYKRWDRYGNLDAIEARNAMGEETCILRISSIFNEVYASLFRYFILPECRDKSINKLVLTYPNTYTPVHLKVLEKIAHETFPKVRNEYLRFVSESDAVAAYYLSNWDSFNTNNTRKIFDDETVLVYDMGAGTLDLTLFKKVRSKKNERKIEVSILGQIGTGKAGNYLDYLIGEIIHDNVEGAIGGENIISTASAFNVQTLRKRLDVKECIKNEIKPNLKPNTRLTCGGKEFDSNVILDDKRFKEFLNQITDEIIRRLMVFIGEENLKIDTILMSGRGCRLASIEESLRTVLNSMNNHNARVLRFDSDGNKEKTAVVEGAMARVGIFGSPNSPVTILSKRLYASYGLIYKRVGGTWRYTELLNSFELPFVSDNTVLGEYRGKNVIAKDTAAAGTIKLIQTYLSPIDTEDAYNANNYEFISEMEEHNMANFDGRDNLNVSIRLDNNNNISLYVDGMVSIGSSPRGIDLSSEITKRNIWPATI